MQQTEVNSHADISAARLAGRIAAAGGFEQALAAGLFSTSHRVTLSEALVLGLLKQGVRKYFAIFGHGSTALAETLRVYEAQGLVSVWQCRNEVEMAHAATVLRWAYGEPSAVVTSIGPGALQAMAGSLAAASNGIGVYHIYGDETTHGEGYNMQQVPKPEQMLYGRITALMGRSYVLHTPDALRDALRRGAATVFHDFKAGPFYLLLPINTQPKEIDIRIETLPSVTPIAPSTPATTASLDRAAELIRMRPRIVVKAGGGSRGHSEAVQRFAELCGAAIVLSPGSTGIVPDDHPQNMHVGGSKGSISGNWAMEQAELLVVVGSRGVCQSDCSGIGYPRVTDVINVNADLDDVQHYNNTTALQGDVTAVLAALAARLEGASLPAEPARQAWLDQCLAEKRRWSAFKKERFAAAPILDPVWARPVLTQPSAIKVVADYCKANGALKLFDAGDVQANGFQIVEDERTDDTITESGSSYMGFAVSGLLAAAAADRPRYMVAFTGDGSFMMNPQILIDGIQHGLHATIVLFDNRRMAAITSLQLAQYGREFRTNDGVAVDYVRLAGAVDGVLALDGGTSPETLLDALKQAHAHRGLSVVHVPVYFGGDPLASMGAYGSWNVGNWVADVEEAYRAAII